jgi:hypothetical protein
MPMHLPSCSADARFAISYFRMWHLLTCSRDSRDGWLLAYLPAPAAGRTRQELRKEGAAVLPVRAGIVAWRRSRRERSRDADEQLDGQGSGGLLGSGGSLS